MKDKWLSGVKREPNPSHVCWVSLPSAPEQLSSSDLYRTHLDPCRGSCRRESDELTCQGSVWDKRQWNNQNYREIVWRMSSTWLFRFKERERNSGEAAFKCLLLRPVTSSPSVCFMILFCTSARWKNQIGHTTPLLTFLDVCSNTQPAPSLSAGKRGKKNNHIRRVLLSEVPDRQQEPSRRLRRRWSITPSWQGMISREKQRFSFYDISHFGSVNQAQDWHCLTTRGLCLAAFFGWVFVTLKYFYSSLPSTSPKIQLLILEVII